MVMVSTNTSFSQVCGHNNEKEEKPSTTNLGIAHFGHSLFFLAPAVHENIRTRRHKSMTHDDDETVNEELLPPSNKINNNNIKKEPSVLPFTARIIAGSIGAISTSFALTPPFVNAHRYEECITVKKMNHALWLSLNSNILDLIATV